MPRAAGVASRVVAWNILRRVHRDGAWVGPAVDAALSDSGLDGRDRAFASNLAFQTLRWQGTLDWALQQVVRRPLTAVEPGLLDLLRMGAWQLLHGNVPDRAVVSTMVDVARSVLHTGTAGFTNGVLRNLARRRESLPWPPPDSVAGIALRTGYPPWVVEAAVARFGSVARAELDAGNEPPQLTIRAMRPGSLRDRLTAEGARVTGGGLAPEALQVEGMAPAVVLERFGGDAVIQDETSMLVARALADAVGTGGARVLDVCAAPGGKSTHLAALGLRVVAADRHAGRLGLVTALAGRLAVPLTAVVADGARPPWRPAAFDGVLVDAPCSGLGVVRRRPELRWRREPGDVAALADLQRRLLAEAAEAVRDGGALVYSVCTWTRAETVEVVEDFLARHGGFALEPPGIEAAAPEPDGPGLQLMTSVHGIDGMYIAVLRRRGRR